MTSYDYVNTLAQKRNMLRIRGVTEKDSLLSLFPLTKYPHGAFLGGVNTSPAFSIPVTIALPGHENERRPEIGSRLDDIVRTAGRTKATIIQGVPTYIRKVIARAQELQISLAETRQIWVTGEGLGDEARADLIARLKLLGARDPEINVAYGLSEIQGGLVECAHGFGYHNPSPDQFLFECVDAESKTPVAGRAGRAHPAEPSRSPRHGAAAIRRRRRGAHQQRALPELRDADRAHRQHAPSLRRAGQDQGHAGQPAVAGRCDDG